METISRSLQISALFVIALVVFISNIQNSLAAITTTKTKTTYNNYLKTSCGSTTYPKLCYNSLAPYTSTIKTNDFKLCNAAMTITLKAASNTSATVKSLFKQKGFSKTELAVIKDCQDEIGGTMNEIKKSLKALSKLKSCADKKFQIDSIKTWLSAAITDEGTCTDGFEGVKVSSKVKSKIRKSISNVNMLTSNALALVNKLNY